MSFCYKTFQFFIKSDFEIIPLTKTKVFKVNNKAFSFYIFLSLIIKLLENQCFFIKSEFRTALNKLAQVKKKRFKSCWASVSKLLKNQ